MSKIKASWALGLAVGGIMLLTIIIPIIQIFSFMPIVLIAEQLRNLISQEQLDMCIKSYELVSISLKLILAILTTYWAIRIYKNPEFRFRRELISMLIGYCISNGFLAIDIITPEHCCFGDGQSILGLLFSAPYASLSPLITGFIFEMTRYVKLSNTTSE